jgi:hypothetical protein
MANYTAIKKEQLSINKKATRFANGYREIIPYLSIAKSNITLGGQVSSDEFPTAYGYL